MKEGWGGLGLEEPKTKTLEITDDERAIAKVFSGDEGQKALAALAKLTVEKPSLETVHPDGINTSILMGLREGENSLYRKILLIKKKVDNYVRRNNTN